MAGFLARWVCLLAGFFARGFFVVATTASVVTRRGAAGQREPVGFSAGQHRQSIHRENTIGARLGRQHGTHCTAQSVELGACGRDHHGNLAPLGVVPRDDDGIGEARLLAHDAFDVVEAHLESATNDRVVDAAQHAQHAVDELTRIVGAVPAGASFALDEGRRGALGIVEVVLGEGRPAELDPAVGGHPHLGPPHRYAFGDQAAARLA